MKGKLIVIEGLDGSGKSTQEKLLEAKLQGENLNVHYIKLPNYDDDACILVKQYLAGRFGDKPEDVNAFAASSFYAVDRYVSYHCYWKEKYLDGGVILADRYTTSNAYHQLTKTERKDWDSYLEWLEDYEYNKLGIPAPDAVIYLDMPVEVSQKLMTSRYSGDENKKDIHEKNTDYLSQCRVAADYACQKLGWVKISCAENGEPLTPEEINQKVYEAVKKVL
ncbi:MAG: deoxynucleoside kinase [Clostridia bacterium]|nr:deoxynucleoside kinase [Clostridia bacterium]